MRNLLKYPVTLEEKLEALNRAIEDELERQKRAGVMGCIHAAALQAARDDVVMLASDPVARAMAADA